jgi:outer membrane protein assembly factor BamB
MGKKGHMIRILLLLAFAPSVPFAAAEDWPHWRGPTRNGLTQEVSGWSKDGWLPEQPSWRANVGQGAAAPIVVGQDVFLLGHAGGKDILRCLNCVDGKERWRQSYACKAYGRYHMGDEGLYSGPSSTPEYDPATRLLYTLSADGDLSCWDTAQEGKQRWTLNLYSAYDVGRRPKLTRAPQRDYGYTSSPLVYKDWLLVEVGATKTGTLIAFDKRTGKQVWASELKDEAGHTGGPALLTIERVPCVVVVTQRHVAALRLDAGNEGKTIATFPWVTDFANTIAGPAVQDDCVLVTAAYNMNTLCKLRFTLREVKELWRKPFPSKVCTPVIDKDHVYVAWQKVRCLSWQTGELRWEGGAFSDPGSCLITGDNKLVVYGHNGKLALLDTAPTATKYQELASRDKIFSSLAWPHVALAGQRLYCRDREGNLVCFALTATK